MTINFKEAAKVAAKVIYVTSATVVTLAGSMVVSDKIVNAVYDAIDNYKARKEVKKAKKMADKIEVLKEKTTKVEEAKDITNETKEENSEE